MGRQVRTYAFVPNKDRLLASKQTFNLSLHLEFLKYILMGATVHVSVLPARPVPAGRNWMV